MKTKFPFGKYSKKHRPVSMEEIVQSIKRGRKESDEQREAVFDAIIKKARSKKRIRTRFSERIKSFGIDE